jgi:tetratricopeptide (TPR) repeat protein
MDGSLSLLLAVVIIIAVAALLIVIATKRGGGGQKKGKQKTRAIIVRDATRRLSQDPHSPEGLIPLADLYYSEHAWEKAYPLYDTMLTIAPAHTEIDPFTAALRQGICAVKLNKLQDAFRGLSGAYRINHDDFEVNYYLGLACYANKEYEKAIPCLKKALVINPEAPNVYSPLGLALYNGKKYREALSFLKRALDENPENKEALFSMADAMAESGFGDKAMKVFLHLRADPEFGARSCLAAGILHAKQNAWEKAIQDFEIGLKHQNMPPATGLELRYRLATACFAIQNISRGITCLREIQATDPAYKDVPQLIQRYQELNQNKNLQEYLMAGTSDFVALCRKIVMSYYQNAFVKILDISVAPENTEVLLNVETAKWEDTEVFRFYRTTGAVGELYVRDFHAKVGDSKADRGICFTAGSFSDEARRYAEGRPIDLIEKEGLVKILKRIDLSA